MVPEERKKKLNHSLFKTGIKNPTSEGVAATSEGVAAPVWAGGAAGAVRGGPAGG